MLLCIHNSVSSDCVKPNFTQNSTCASKSLHSSMCRGKDAPSIHLDLFVFLALFAKATCVVFTLPGLVQTKLQLVECLNTCLGWNGCQWSDQQSSLFQNSPTPLEGVQKSWLIYSPQRQRQQLNRSLKTLAKVFQYKLVLLDLLRLDNSFVCSYAYNCMLVT